MRLQGWRASHACCNSGITNSDLILRCEPAGRASKDGHAHTPSPFEARLRRAPQGEG
jgi:hypothetical protein